MNLSKSLTIILNNPFAFSIEELKLGTSYEELLNIIKTQTFDRIESLALELKNANIDSFFGLFTLFPPEVTLVFSAPS